MPKPLEQKIARNIRAAHPSLSPKQARSAAIATMIKKHLWTPRRKGGR